jgi:hypothetical protein
VQEQPERGAGPGELDHPDRVIGHLTPFPLLPRRSRRHAPVHQQRRAGGEA